MLFGFQGEQIIAQPLVIVLLAVPILIQVYFNAGLAYWLSRRFGVAWCVAAPAALIGASNFFELAVAAAISLFGLNSGAALATVVGVLVEVPVMLSVVHLVKLSRGWYEAGGEAQPAVEEGSADVSVTIYHNPACGTSRNTLAMIRQSGEEPEMIEYLKTPPSRARLVELIKAMGMPVRALLREKDTPYAELGLADRKWSDEELIDFMLDASDPDQPAHRRDAEGRKIMPAIGGRARYSSQSAYRPLHERGRPDHRSSLKPDAGSSGRDQAPEARALGGRHESARTAWPPGRVSMQTAFSFRRCIRST